LRNRSTRENAFKADPKPTDVEFPMRRRTYAWPIAIGVSAVIVIGAVLFALSARQMSDIPDPAVTPPAASDTAG
jgi:hypothetical protein